jgi:uncharacterized protein
LTGPRPPEPAPEPNDDATALCLSCGFCCNGVAFQYGQLEGDEVDLAARLGMERTVNAAGKMVFRQPCPCHRDGRCSVYPDRPRACASYECELLKRARRGEITFQAAREKVEVGQDLLRSLRTHFPGRDILGSVWNQAREEWDLRPENLQSESFQEAHGEAMLSLYALSALLKRHFLKPPSGE